jgi:hypothetical protein
MSLLSCDLQLFHDAKQYIILTGPISEIFWNQGKQETLLQKNNI